MAFCDTQKQFKDQSCVFPTPLENIPSALGHLGPATACLCAVETRPMLMMILVLTLPVSEGLCFSLEAFVSCLEKKKMVKSLPGLLAEDLCNREHIHPFGFYQRLLHRVPLKCI